MMARFKWYLESPSPHQLKQKKNIVKVGPPPPTLMKKDNEPRYEISNNVVCATSKGSDQPAHTCSVIRAFFLLVA